MSLGAVTWFMLSFAMEGIIGLLESCIHGGAEYRDGDFFLPNDTIIKTDGPRQCVQCRCLQGLVLCEIDSCPFLQCETPVRNSHLCCPRCPGSLAPAATPPVPSTMQRHSDLIQAADPGKGSEENSDLVIGAGNLDLGSRKKLRSDCFSNGNRFRNGSSWQPVVGPFGVMACVECRCHEGVIVCSRLQCERLVCPQPRRELGQCCPVCPASGEKRCMRGGSSSRALREGEKGRWHAESGRKAFCLPRLNELFVFRTENVRNNSDRIEYAFVENERRNDPVKIHTWNLRAKNPADILTLSAVPRKELGERKLHILGSMSKRQFRKYTKRERKLRDNCWTWCLAKIERLEKALVEYSVSARSKCGEDEVDVAELYEGW